MGKARVSFVILHYKEAEVTDSCVRSILKMDGQEQIRIIIVDNDIHEDLQKRKGLAERYEKFPCITVLPIFENGGFSYANNQGYAYAREKEQADFVVVLNNDIEFLQKDFIRRLEESYEKNSCAVLGPDIIKKSTKEHQNPLDWRTRTREEADATIRKNKAALKFYPVLYPALYWNYQRMVRMQTKQRTKQETICQTAKKEIVLFGACLIFTPDFVKKEEKAFEPETRFFYEEHILAERCRKKNYSMCYDPSMIVYHESGSATRKNYQKEKERLRFTMERTIEAAEIYRNYVDS